TARGERLGGRLGRHPGESVQLVCGGALAVGLEQLGRVNLLGAHARGRLGGAQFDQTAHTGAWPGLGTPKPPSTGSGAASRTSSRSRHGAGSSARIGLAASTTCEVGGTAPRSS